MLDKIINDIYEYICSFLDDTSFIKLSSTCKTLFNKRDCHLLKYCYSLDVLLQTGYNVSGLDLTEQQKNKPIMITKSIYNRLLKVTHVICNKGTNLNGLSKNIRISLIIDNCSFESQTIPDNVYSLEINHRRITPKFTTLEGGKNLESLTITRYIDISELQTLQLKTLIIRPKNEAARFNITSLDLKKHDKLHTFQCEYPIDNFILSSSLRVLKLTNVIYTRIYFGTLPNLEILHLGTYKYELEELPQNLKHLDLRDYDGELILPKSLVTLVLGDTFNHDIILNEGLLTAKFGKRFNKPLKLPSTLSTLTLEHNYFSSHITFNDNLEFLDLTRLDSLYAINMKDIPDKTQIILDDRSQIFELFEPNKCRCFDD